MLTSLNEIVTFSLNLDLMVVTPSGSGGNCAAEIPIKALNSS